MICPHCQADSTMGASCSSCGYSLTKMLPIVSEKTELPWFWIASGTELNAGCQEIVPCRFANTTGGDLTILRISVHFWQQKPQHREICKTLRPGEECAVGIPFFAEYPGRYLLTRLSVAACVAEKNCQWQTEDEAILEVLAGAKKQALYQINLQDYAQIFGNIETGQNSGWQRLRLSLVKPDIPKLDYCCLKISTGGAEKYCYLCLRQEAWLGRSSLVEFQVLLRGYSPDHPKNLMLSAKQAKVLCKNNRWLIEDSGSRNGTRINGIALPTGHSFLIGHRDRITLADSLDLVAYLHGSSLRLSHEGSQDVFLALGGEISMGNSSDCAIYIDTLRERVIVMPKDEGIALSPLCEFFHNGQRYSPQSFVLLKLGDELRFQDTIVKVQPG